MEHGESKRKTFVNAPNPQTSASVTLRTAQDAVALLDRSRAIFQPLNVLEVRLAMEALPPPMRPILETRLNVYLKECGCAASNVAAAISILVYVFLLFLLVGNPLTWSWRHLLIGIPFILIFAIAGKLQSQFRARRKFINVLESILQVCQTATTEKED